MIEHRTIITTIDGKMFTFPSHEKQEQLWAIKVDIASIGPNGSEHFVSCSPKIFHVTRRTLEDCGMIPMCYERVQKKEEPTETVESLILRLLEMVGVFPKE